MRVNSVCNLDIAHLLSGENGEDQLVATLESITEGFFACDGEWRFLYVNAAAERALGIQRNEVLGKSHWELFPSLLGTPMEEEYRRAARGESSDFEWFHEPCGRWLHNRCFPRGGGGISVYFQDITDHRRTQEALLQERDLLQSIMNGAKNSHLAYLDRDFNFVCVNESYATTCGYSPEEMVGKNHFALYPHPENEAIFARVRDTGEPFEVHDKPFEFPDQPERGVTWWDWTLCPLKGQTGEVSGLVFSLFETTSRKRAEEALLASEQRYKSIVETQTEFVERFLPGGVITFSNDALANFAGLSKDELLGRSFYPFIHEDEREDVVSRIESICRENPTVEIECRNVLPDGRIRWTRCTQTGIFDEQGLLIEYQMVGRDITELKLSEEALRNNEWFLRECQRIAQIGTYDLGVTDDLWTSSPELDRILGVDEAYPRDLQSGLAIIHPDFRGMVEGYLASVLSENKPFSFEYKIIRPSDGVERWLHGTGEFKCDADGRPVRLIGAIQDITDRKEAEENLKKLNEELDQRVAERTAQLEAAMKEQESFSYSVSHDLRAPLRHINSFGAILADDYGTFLPSEALQYLARMRKASSRMGQLIDDLLEFSRVGRAEVSHQKVNLSRKAAKVVAMLQETEPARNVEWVIADGLTIHGDSTLLQQVLENLLENAWKYTVHQARARIEFGRRIVDGQKAFFVRDNGTGFDMAYVDKLFHPFQRLHSDADFKGTGIGLATVKRIIERHGGRVWAEGKVGGGATVYFALPDEGLPPLTPAH